jgi:flagellar biosynthesis protein FlhA
VNNFFQNLKSKFSGLGGNTELAFVGGVIAAIFLLVIPVHKDLLSILLVFSIAISILILLTVIYLEDPSEFLRFPDSSSGSNPIQAWSQCRIHTSHTS